MKAAPFYDSVASEIQEVILSVPLLHRMDELTSEQIRFFCSQYYHLVQAFPRYLGALIWLSTDEKVRLTLVDNLVDECGGMENIEKQNLLQTHPEIFRRVTRA